jgi:lysozyme family protein
MNTFENAFRVVIGEEGGYTANTADPGNWTGGRCGAGRCNGTKYGISAATYPALDIAALTLDEARAVYRRDYCDHVHGDDLPPTLALLVFDAAVNSGPGRAIKWLQAALGVRADGVLGPVSLGAARDCAGNGAAVAAEYQAQRMVFLAGLPTWRTFGLGWARRICRLQFEALRVGEAG